jgi:hypothetical protein
MKRVLASIALMFSVVMVSTPAAATQSVADGLPHCCV